MDTFDRDPLVVLSTVARIVRTLADARARTHGMTRAQWMLLVHIDRQPGISQNELATLIEVEPITVGRLIDRLETRGMVERCAHPSDRRVWKLHLTSEATPMLEEIAKARAELNEILVEGIPQKDLDATIDCLLQMKTNLSDTRSSKKTA